MTDIAAYIQSLRGPILVTGASGFIGANLFKSISATRQDVFGCVRREKGWRLADVSDKSIALADLNDSIAIKNLIDSIGPQTVFDCATYGGYSFEKDPSRIYLTNFLSTTWLVSKLAARPLAAYIHAGSSSEYGTNCAAPAEVDACFPNSDYAVSKLAAANYLQFMGKQHAFPCVNLRLYSVYGPLEDTSRLMPNLLRQALAGGLPPLVDSRTSRDFIHVDDVCAAFIMAAAEMHPGLYGENFNIGSGIRTTIGELAELTRGIFGVGEKPQFGTMEGRAWDLADWYANPTKARLALGWNTYICLEDGLRKTAKWVASLTDSDRVAATKKTTVQRKRSLSAIVACYRDGQAIPVMYERLSRSFSDLGVDYEIIFVNDGSPDDSGEVIRKISEDDARVIGVAHSRNFGSQMAFRSGMELATKDGVVLLDGDLQDPPELIELFYAKWAEGFDVIYGIRVKRQMPWYQGIMYKMFYRVFATFSYVKVPLDAGDFSLMDRRVVEWLLNCPERDLFVRGLRAYVGFKQTGVDYVRPERMFGRSTNNLIKNIAWAKKGIFSFSNTPLTMLTMAGVFSLCLSTALAVIVALLRLFVPDIAPRGVTTLLIAILMFGSFNLFAIGVVGEYVAKIMAEVKRRPRLIRSALIRNGEITEAQPDRIVR